MKFPFSFIVMAVLFAVSMGCNADRSVETTAEADPAPEQPAETQTENDVDGIGDSVEAVAKVRRDGNDSIIEVDLREVNLSGDVASVFEQLPQLPKLRSVLLSDSTITDAGLEIVGRISTLENLDLRGCGVGDEGLAHLAGLGRLKSIKFSGKNGKTKVTDAGLETLGRLKTLKVIALDFLPITDQGIARLSELSQMRELYLAGTEVTDESAKSLAKFPKLAKLRIASTKFGSAGLDQLGSLSELVELDVSECEAIDNDALKTLGNFKKLAKLNVYSTSISDAAWDELADSKDLRWLNVDKTSVTDESLDQIGKLAELTFLHLGSTQITDAGLEQLAGLSKLEKLIVTRTAVTAAGVEQLQPMLPKTEIQLEYVPGK